MSRNKIVLAVAFVAVLAGSFFSSTSANASPAEPAVTPLAAISRVKSVHPHVSPQYSQTLWLCYNGDFTDCVPYVPAYTLTCRVTGQSFQSAWNDSNQAQYVFTSGHCGTGYRAELRPGDPIDHFPVGSFRHT